MLLARDNVELRKLYEDVESQQLPIQRAAFVGELLMQELTQLLDETHDPRGAEDRVVGALHDVAMRVQDLHTMEEVHVQYFVSIELTRQNNNRLGQAVDRTYTLATNVVTVGLAIQATLIRQKRVMEATQRTRQYIGELITVNAATIKRHTRRSAISTTSRSWRWTRSCRRTTICSPRSTPRAGCARKESKRPQEHRRHQESHRRIGRTGRRARTGRRGAQQPMKRITLVIGILVIALVGAFALRDAVTDHPDPLVIVHWSNSHPMREGLLPQMAEQFNEAGHKTSSGRPIEIKLVSCDSAVQAEDLVSRVNGSGAAEKRCEGSNPTIITPQATDWLVDVNSTVGHTVVDLADTKSIAKTWVGIVTYRAMAECLGWPAKPIRYADIIELRKVGWDNPATRGCARTEWGRDRCSRSRIQLVDDGSERPASRCTPWLQGSRPANSRLPT